MTSVGGPFGIFGIAVLSAVCGGPALAQVSELGIGERPCESDTTLSGLFIPSRVVHVRLPDTLQFVTPSMVVVNSRGELAVVDAADYDVKLFDVEGRFSGRAGGRGEGPGKIATPTVLATFADDSTLHVTDVGRRRLIMYEFPEGTFIGEVAVDVRPAGGIGVLGGTTAIAGLGPWNRFGGKATWESVKSLHLLGPDRRIRSILKPPANPMHQVTRSTPLIAVQPAMRGEDARFLVAWRHDSAVVIVAADGSVVRREQAALAPPWFRSGARTLDAPPDRRESKSMVVSLTATPGVVVVGYIRDQINDHALRYAVLNRELAALRTNVGSESHLITAARGDTLVSLKLDESTLSSQTVVFHTMCR